MLWNISVFHFLIYAAGIGFAAAIVYTNIQRTAFSKFFCYLLDNCCFAEESAKTLDDIGLDTFEKRIVVSAIKHQYGFRKYVKSFNRYSVNNEVENVFNKDDNTLYYLFDADIDLLRKKYSFKTMPKKFVILFVVILALIIIIASSSVSWLIDKVTTPKLEDKIQTEESKEMKENSEQLPGYVVPDESQLPTKESPDDSPAGPRIPV